MGFIQDFISKYGSDAYSKFKQWEDLSIKLATIENRRNFLLHCKNNNISPDHISNNLSCLHNSFLTDHPFNNDVNNVFTNFKNKIIKIEIKIAIWHIKKTKEEIEYVISLLEPNIQLNTFTELKNIVNRLYNKHYINVKRTQCKKVERLAGANASIVDRSQWINNLSHTPIPDEVYEVLALGPKFSLVPQKSDIKICDIIKDLESCMPLTPLDDRDTIRGKTTNLITNFLQDTNTKNTDIDRKYTKTRAFLKENNNLIVTRADKGNSTVILEKQDYTNKMLNLLEDTATYTTINKDPTEKLQDNSNKIIDKLFKNNKIEETKMKNLKKHNSVSPCIYGLPKIHKPNNPLRPVVSCIDSPSYNLAKLCHELLKPITTTFTHNINNSFELLDVIKDLTLPEDYVLISLDVTSLFTNVTQEMVQEVVNKKWRFIQSYTDCSKQEIQDIIKFIFDSSYFKFQDKFYKQNAGTAMGNPASPVMADFVMDYIIEQALAKIPFKILLALIYVDDMLLAVPKDKINLVINIFNSIFSKIQFTCEQETNQSIPFLDINIIRGNDGKIITEWYCKPSSSYRVINFKSNHPHSQKIGILKSFKNRISRLCHPTLLKKNLDKLKVMFLLNNYPNKLINSILYNHKSKQSNSNAMKEHENKNYRRFPYIPKLSHNISKVLNKSTSITLGYYNFKTVGKLFTKTKDKIDKNNQSNLVYKIPCGNCTKVYIGQTKQLLKKRLYNHKLDCRPYNINKNEMSALAKHHFEYGHNFKFEETQILDREHNLQKRLISEMVHIKSNKNAVNVRSDTQNLSCIYNNLIDM